MRAIATDGTRVIAAATITGEVVLGGSRLSADGNDLTVVAFDARGDYAWHRIFDAMSVADVALDADPAGNVYIAGNATVITFGGTQHFFDWSSALFVAKLSPSGEVLWSKGFRRRLTQQTELQVQLGVDAQGNALLAGFLESGEIDFGPGHLVGPATPVEWYLVKLDPSGNPSWHRRFPDVTSAVLGVDGSGTAVLAGLTIEEVNLGGPPPCSFDHCFTVAGFDPAGTRSWLAQWLGSANHVSTVDVVPGSLLLTVQNGVDFGGGWVAKNDERFHVMLGENGAFRWAHNAGRAYEERGTIAASGVAYVAGFFWGKNTVGGTELAELGNLQALYLAGYDANGSQRFARVIGVGSLEVVGVVATESGPVIGGNYTSTLELDRTLAASPQGSMFFARSAP